MPNQKVDFNQIGVCGCGMGEELDDLQALLYGFEEDPFCGDMFPVLGPTEAVSVERVLENFICKPDVDGISAFCSLQSGIFYAEFKSEEVSFKEAVSAQESFPLPTLAEGLWIGLFIRQLNLTEYLKSFPFKRAEYVFWANESHRRFIITIGQDFSVTARLVLDEDGTKGSIVLIGRPSL